MAGIASHLHAPGDPLPGLSPLSLGLLQSPFHQSQSPQDLGDHVFPLSHARGAGGSGYPGVPGMTELRVLLGPGLGASLGKVSADRLNGGRSLPP